MIGRRRSLAPSRVEGLFVLQPEQPVDRFGVGSLRFLVGKRLQLFGGLEEQLLDDQPRDLVDARARFGRQRTKLAFEALQLRAANRFETLPQRDDGRYGAA